MLWRTDLKTIAFSAGPVVVTGRYFEHLALNEQLAIIAHERGHIYHRHQLKRLWWVISFQWRGMAEKCKLQELQADKYAVLVGCADGLVSFLKQFGPHESPLHPTQELRIQEIELWKTTVPSEPVAPAP
jgi:hypothetical protein